MLTMLFGFLPTFAKESLSEVLPKSHRIFEFSAGTLVYVSIDCNLKYMV